MTATTPELQQLIRAACMQLSGGDGQNFNDRRIVNAREQLRNMAPDLAQEVIDLRAKVRDGEAT